MSARNVILIQLRNPVGKEEPVPVLRVFDDVHMLRLKRAFFEDTLCQVAQIDHTDVKVAVAPPTRAVWARDAIAHLAERFPDQRGYQTLAARTEIIAQPVAPIEERSTANLQHCLSNGYRHVILMAGYLPTIRAELIADAVHHLSRHPLILGPTIEGGCYLIGVRSDCPEAVGLVSIGSDVSYSQSTASLTEAGLSWQEIDLSYDVSHQEDLEFIVREINHCRFTGDEDTARCTEAVLADFMRERRRAGDGQGVPDSSTN
ncbi:MAG: DUF2064 domain-containing protein [candidate division Zixibacteria bacterium]|nr:DUF2064 domain-containing protein [candidate division Zixibacteria bacterium]